MNSNSLLRTKNQLINEVLNYENILDQLPGIVFIKDSNFNYLFVNNAGINAAQFKDKDEVIGKSDLEMPWADLADKFVEQDTLSYMGQTQFTVELNPKALGGSRSLTLLKKSPFYSSSKEILGVCCIGFELDYQNYKNMFTLFTSTHLKFNDFIVQPEITKKKYIYGDLKLSKRQAQLISLLLKGYSIKGIARNLDLSARTVEYYFEEVKDKLLCYDKPSIIKKAFELGFIDLMFWDFSDNPLN